MQAIDEQLQANSFELRLSGIDELNIKHDSPLLEACNTSFQVHLQVAPKDFVPLYNIAQTLAAPLVSIAANSPLVFGRRLWHESRIALFQQSLDTRTSHEHMRERSPRVNFGKGWLRDSILEIYRKIFRGSAFCWATTCRKTRWRWSRKRKFLNCGPYKFITPPFTDGTAPVTGSAQTENHT